MAEFKDRFKQLRLERELTQKELGDLLGYSESNISLYEAGKRQPKTAEDYVKIANFFGVSLDFLMGLTNNSNVKDDILKDNLHLIEVITPKSKVEQLKDYLVSVGYMKSYNDLNTEQLDFIKDTIERYLKMTNNYKEKSED